MKQELTEKQKQVIENIRNECKTGEEFDAESVSDNKTRIALLTLKKTGHIEHVRVNYLNGKNIYKRLF